MWICKKCIQMDYAIFELNPHQTDLTHDSYFFQIPASRKEICVTLDNFKVLILPFSGTSLSRFLSKKKNYSSYDFLFVFNLFPF